MVYLLTYILSINQTFHEYSPKTFLSDSTQSDVQTDKHITSWQV